MKSSLVFFVCMVVLFPMSSTALGGNSQDSIILETILQPSQGSPTGNRVYASGRYEAMSDQEIIVGDDGKVTYKKVDLKWRPVFTFTPNELAELHVALVEADFARLDQIYSPKGQTFEGSTLIWQVMVDGQLKKVVVKGYPLNKVAPLERLYLRFNQIHKMPKASTVWKVRSGTTVIERSIDGDVSSIDFLRPVTHALFASDNLDNPKADKAKRPSKNILLEIDWKEEGRSIEVTRLFEDGRYVLIRKKRTTLVKTLNTAQLALVSKELLAINWSGLAKDSAEQSVARNELIKQLAVRGGDTAAIALQKLIDGGKPSVAALVLALDISDEQTRALAAEGLSQLADPASANRLFGALSDSSDKVRGYAALTLDVLRDKRALDALAMTIDDAENVLQTPYTISMYRLISHGPSALRNVVPLLKAPKPLTRKRAFLVLQRIFTAWRKQDYDGLLKTNGMYDPLAAETDRNRSADAWASWVAAQKIN
jgi:hypothetical protein